MRSTIALAFFALSGVSAAIVRRQQSCCFGITASGGVTGAFTQLGDGQNRLNDTGTPAQFCINNGRIIDSAGRGCIITPEASQFQCDLNRPPSPGFSITSSGQLLHNGTSTFWACPATDTTYNIYDVPVANQLKCRMVSLSTSGNCTNSTGFGTGVSGPTAGGGYGGFAGPSGYGSTYLTPAGGFGPTPNIAPTGSAPYAGQSSGAGYGSPPYPLPTSSFVSDGQSGPSGYGPAPSVAPTGTVPGAGQSGPTGYGPAPSVAPTESAPYPTQSGSYGAVPNAAPSGSVPGAAPSGPTGYGSAPNETPSGPAPAGQSSPTGYGSTPTVVSSESTPVAPQSSPSAYGTPSVSPPYTQYGGTTLTVPTSIAPESSSFGGFGPSGHGSLPVGESTTPAAETTQPAPETSPAAPSSASSAACEQATVTVTFTQTANCEACGYGSATAPYAGGGPTAPRVDYGGSNTPPGTAPGGYPSSGYLTGFSAPGAAPTAWDSSAFLPTPSGSYYRPGSAGTVPVAGSSESVPGQSVPSSNGYGSGNSYPQTTPTGASVPGQSVPAESLSSNGYGPVSSYAQPTPTESFETRASSSYGTGTSTGVPSACQTSLTGAYQTPHLMIPISNTSPSESGGTSYNGIVNSTTSTIFNFDIPQSYEGKSCSIIFLFPSKEQLETSDYTFSGSGGLKFAALSDVASQSTTWDTAPSVFEDLGIISIQPGNSYVIRTESCKAGLTESIQLSSEGGLSLDFFEDWNPSSLGLYITAC